MSTCYTLNSTADVVAETAKTLNRLGFRGFLIDTLEDKCLALWDVDGVFTTLLNHEPNGVSPKITNKVYDNVEEFLEVVKKELLGLPEEKQSQLTLLERY